MNNNMLSEKDTKAVFDILVEQLGVPEEQITLDARLEEDLGGDSLTAVEITLALEERSPHSGGTMCMEGLKPISSHT